MERFGRKIATAVIHSRHVVECDSFVSQRSLKWGGQRRTSADARRLKYCYFRRIYLDGMEEVRGSSPLFSTTLLELNYIWQALALRSFRASSVDRKSSSFLAFVQKLTAYLGHHSAAKARLTSQNNVLLL